MDLNQSDENMDLNILFKTQVYILPFKMSLGKIFQLFTFID